jgi:hypothetical protein
VARGMPAGACAPSFRCPSPRSNPGDWSWAETLARVLRARWTRHRWRRLGRGAVRTRLCETRAWIGPVQVRRGPDRVRQRGTGVPSHWTWPGSTPLTCGGPGSLRRRPAGCLTESGPRWLFSRRCLIQSGPRWPFSRWCLTQSDLQRRLRIDGPSLTAQLSDRGSWAGAARSTGPHRR